MAVASVYVMHIAHLTMGLQQKKNEKNFMYVCVSTKIKLTNMNS